MMARYNLKILLLQVGLLGCIPSAFTRSISSVYTGDCDSIFLSNGTAFAVKNLNWNDEGISFAFCHDSTSLMRTAPWMQIHHIKKVDGSIMESPAVVLSKVSTLTEDELRVEDQVDKMHLMAILALPAILLFGLGFILAVVVLVKAKRLRKAVIGHPNEHRLLRKIKRSKLIAMAMLFSWVLLGLIQFVYLIYLFSLLGKEQ